MRNDFIGISFSIFINFILISFSFKNIFFYFYYNKCFYRKQKGTHSKKTGKKISSESR